MGILVLVGVVWGILIAFLTTKKKKDFRKYLLSDLERHLNDGTASGYVTWIAEHRAQWEKPFSLVRKPFKDEINLIIETAAFLLALLGLVTSLTSYSRIFESTAQGDAVIIFFGIILAFVPCERVLTSRINREIDAVLSQLRDADRDNKLESYITEARREWV